MDVAKIINVRYRS